jgi:hypothetical protein
MWNIKKMKNTLISTLCLFVLIACHQTDKFLVKDIPNWDRLVVDTNQERIVIGNDVDSKGNTIEYGRRVYWNLEEIYKETGSRERTTTNYKEEVFHISKQEKDSLFVWIYDIVTNPVCIGTEQDSVEVINYHEEPIKVTVSCDIGYTTLSCRYRFTQNWTTISPPLNKVYSMLKSKTKISEH